MRLAELKVTNYRGLREVSIPLSRFVCVTGENNSGKSSVLQVLSLFLSGSTLTTTDFFEDGKEILIEVKLADITSEDLNLLAKEHRDRITPLLTDDSLMLVRRYGPDGKGQLEYRGLVPKDGRFHPDAVDALVFKKKAKALRDAVIQSFPELDGKIEASATQADVKEEIEKLAFGLPVEEKESRLVPLPTGLDKSITPMLPERIYIPAVKNLADDTKTAEGSSFGKILGIVMKSIEPMLKEDSELFEKLSRKLTRTTGPDGVVHDDRLDAIKNIEAMIEGFVRESFASVTLEIDVPPPELKSVLSTARIVADDGVKGPLELKGDGLRRAVVFSILRSYCEIARSAQTQGAGDVGIQREYLLLFEEPELFLHPAAQKVLFDALGVFATRNHVVVTTHSPLFFGAENTATFIRLSKTTVSGVPKPFTKERPVDLMGMGARDAFQLICYENNAAAFFANTVVLVEGDCDFIVFPHVAELLDARWSAKTRSVAFVRVSGKGSIRRYREFFSLFEVPVRVITDLDALDDGFDQLDPSETAKRLRSDLIQKVDAANAAAGSEPALRTKDIRSAHDNPSIRALYAAVQSAKIEYDKDQSRADEVVAALAAFFDWEKKYVRRECIRKAVQRDVREAKHALIWELRRKGVFVLEKGDLEDYYPTDVTGPDKPSRALAFRARISTRSSVLPLSRPYVCTATGEPTSELQCICSSIFCGCQHDDNAPPPGFLPSKE